MNSTYVDGRRVDKSQETRLIGLKLCSATSRSRPSHFRRARTTRLTFKVSVRHVKLFILSLLTKYNFVSFDLDS
jgi:hypothetical protein